MPKRVSNRLAAGRAGARKPARDAILSAAERVFALRGLAGARTDAIAAAAGVNHALLYYYFRSKEHLYQAVLEDQFAGFNTQALKVLAGPGPARDVLLRYVSLHFDFMSARRRHAPLFQPNTIGLPESVGLPKSAFSPAARAPAPWLKKDWGTPMPSAAPAPAQPTPFGLPAMPSAP